MSIVSDSVKKLVENIKDDALQEVLFFVLQPLIHTHDGRCVGAEALIRGNVDGTIIYPDRFIPQLEKNGDIKKVGLFVLQNALRFACEHRWYKNTEFRLSVNFSPLEINDSKTVKKIAHIGGKTPFRRQNIVIEITETAIPLTLQGRQNAVWLQDQGFTLAWDDICEPAELTKNDPDFTADVIKLDRSVLFPGALNRARQLIEMCRARNWPVIVEGVENTQQLQWLVKQGVLYCQGYLFSPPVDVERFQSRFFTLNKIGEAQFIEH
ncbi:EAL domain-containing protein [uncultured Leclercia sp.]|uniref:EAL domain-containing protein n=1 Tax=uncultured Leclercia sp. TaxID=332959 RepID=UPI002591BBB8|nr:EAL domain-containing protein [uncultured Leclercia sp.]